MSVERQEIKFRGKHGSIQSGIVFIPNHDKDPKLAIPSEGLNQNSPRLDFREPSWIPPHLRKPSWRR